MDSLDRLTKEQVERQDFVDAEILNLLDELAPEGMEEVKEGNAWEIVATVRDAIMEAFEQYKVMTAADFYPYI